MVIESSFFDKFKEVIRRIRSKLRVEPLSSIFNKETKS
jgi:hypothetical protein